MADTGERIAAAARRMLEDEGSSAVSMRRVASAAGVTPMAAYRHYANRTALLAAVADDAFAEVAKSWGGRTESIGFDERFDGLERDFLDFALHHPHLYSFLILEPRDGARIYPDGFGPDGSPLFGQVVAAVEQGMAEGALRDDDPIEVAAALTMPAVGLVALYLGGRMSLDEEPFRALVHRTIRRVLDGVRA